MTPTPVTRRMRVLTPTGVEFLDVTPSQTRVVGRHWNAIRNYLDYGRDQLRQFDGISIAGRALETDPASIEAWAIRGEIRFESIYEDGQ